MIELLLGGLVPPQLTSIEIINPPEITITEPVKEITWRDNPQGCDQETQWIAAESPFYCIPKKYTTNAKTTTRTPQNGSKGLNGYVLNSCTGWVATHRYVPAGWGDATNWRNAALNAGWYVGSEPIVGAIGWVYGHVVYVEKLNGDGTVTISERNYDWHGSIRTVVRPISDYTYLY